jgi:CMP-N,N'-diacetyllegionaminic acid synthase
MKESILVTVCARGGSKGLPGKNIKPLLGKPLIVHSLQLARRWNENAPVWVSTDSEEIRKAAVAAGFEVPTLRPAELATDAMGKLPVLTQALLAAEKHWKTTFDRVIDLDPTAPIRQIGDLERGYETALKTGAEVVFSVVPARKNPYFNMVERGPNGAVKKVRDDLGSFAGRQAAPRVWDMNASIYVYQADFLRRNPATIWDGTTELFEMAPETAFDIDTERDFAVVQALMEWGSQKGNQR